MFKIINGILASNMLQRYIFLPKLQNKHPTDCIAHIHSNTIFAIK